MNRVVLALTETTVCVSIKALGTVLKARFAKERAEQYRNELLYLLVKRYYEDVKQPHEVMTEIMRYKPPMDAKAQAEEDKGIIQSLIDRL